MSIPIAFAITAFIAFAVATTLVWCMSKPRTRRLAELFGVAALVSLFTIAVVLSILSLYGDR